MMSELIEGIYVFWKNHLSGSRPEIYKKRNKLLS